MKRTNQIESEHAIRTSGVFDLRGEYRPDIDGLRAIAVLLVVGFHVFPEWIRGGYVGVDIFFVISGFLITGILLKETAASEFKFSRFYARRIKRIFPALIIVLLTCLIVGWWALLPDEYKALGKHIFSGSAFFSNFMLLSDAGYFDTASERKPLLHLWSLGIEEQFYIFWPLILISAVKLRANIGIVIAMIIAISFALNLYLIGSHPTATFYLPIARAWELLAGGLLWWIMSRRRFETASSLASNTRASLGIFLIGCAVVLLTKESKFPGWWATLPVIGAALLISAPCAYFNRIVLSSRGFVFFGLISYPLYLWHWPLFSFYTIVDTNHTSVAARIGIGALSIALAWLTYEFIEKPVRFGRRSTIAVSIVSVSLAATGTLGVLVFVKNGFDFRVPEAIRSFASTQVDTSHWRMHVCLLESNDKVGAFAPECTEQGSAPLLLLWGDSYAGAFYPGLKSLQGSVNFRLAQYTTAGCPPIPSFKVDGRPHCPASNDAVLSIIGSEHPDIVLLHSIWNYPGLLPERLDDTVAAIRRLGIYRIVMLGPPPGWTTGLPQAIYEHYRTHGWQNEVPERSRHLLNEGFGQLDKALRQEAEKLGISYISAWDTMCNADGCLTRIGNSLVTQDYGHLTVPAATYLAQKIESQLFK